MPGSTGVLAVVADAIGAARAEQVLTRFDRYSNQPNAITGAVRLPSDPALERAALRVFDDPDLGALAGLDASSLAEALDARTLWALLALAARADVTVLDRLPADTAERGAPKIATIRRAAAKHAAALGSAPASPAAPASAEAPGSSPAPAGNDVPALPEKVAQVASWLAAHPGADPRWFAARPGQRAAERRVAFRALGSIGTPAALDVLAGYARDGYPDVELAELHRAWGRFDRRAFAATMFRPEDTMLQLGACSTLEGIGAVQGLTGLGVILTERADLAPLAECTALRRLHVNVAGAAGVTGVEALSQLPGLTELHLLGTTRGADLTALRDTAVERLSLSLDGADGAFLTRLPHLRSLKLSGGSAPEDSGYDSEDGTVPLPAHPGLVDVVLRLLADGVQVVVLRHERSWVSRLTAAVPSDVYVVERSGYVGLTRDGSDVEGLGRRLFSNVVP
ncbi:hypothetical protein M768_16560 [Cellulosimicrobium cellulans F16]|uniref:Uncharacterized protein n=1 Tax=Cellulosimicrobium cellulans F16 TaxID=1350482 RepID=A0A0M0F3W9_CELCE|nr:hypothetical protein [Cellulosimicrobium cellulans]KON72072.1 hypothetical protein M768_16560 [Cellulosimicrobium cellulans F16]